MHVQQDYLGSDEKTAMTNDKWMSLASNWDKKNAVWKFNFPVKTHNSKKKLVEHWVLNITYFFLRFTADEKILLTVKDKKLDNLTLSFGITLFNF